MTEVGNRRRIARSQRGGHSSKDMGSFPSLSSHIINSNTLPGQGPLENRQNSGLDESTLQVRITLKSNKTFFSLLSVH